MSYPKIIFNIFHGPSIKTSSLFPSQLIEKTTISVNGF